MAASWDRRSLRDQQRLQSQLLRQTVLQMAIGHVPFVRTRLAAAGIDPRSFRGLEDLDRIPPTLRRDVVDPRRNPEGPQALVLDGTAEGVKRFADRGSLLKVARARLVGGEHGQQLAVEAANRPIHIHLAEGPGGAIPVAYTRDDLDLLARAGARIGSVLGLDREDRLLNLVPFGPTLDFWGIFYMAHGMGVSAVHARPQRGDLAASLAAAFDGTQPTAIAIPSDEAAALPQAAADERLDLSKLRTVAAVGRSLTPEERVALGEALLDAGATDARVASAYAVAEGRTLWAECAVPAGRPESYGFHTSPDLELVEIGSAETGESLPPETPGEIMITPLGFRGGGAPRWRSGDFAPGGLTTRPCPNCGRTVPRIGPSVSRRAWERELSINGGPVVLDLRDLGAAVGARSREWQLEVVGRRGGDDLFVYLDPRVDDPTPVIDLYEDLARWDVPPVQIVVVTPDEIADRLEEAGGQWPRFWERGTRAPAPE